MAYRAVLFDIDGTLVHTLPEYRYRTVGAALRQLQREFSLGDIDRFWFEGDRNAVIRECFQLEPKEFWTVFRKIDLPEHRKEFTRLYEDVGAVQELRTLGYQTGIVTGAPPDVANINLDKLGREQFDVIFIASSLNGKNNKPHPEGLLYCLDQLRLDLNEAVYVGNADEDVIMARNAGMLDIIIDRHEMIFPAEIKPTIRINSLYELREILES